MGLFRSLTIGLFVLAIPIALVTTNVRFVASEPRVYDYAVREYGAESASGVPEPELRRANRELVRYFKADDPGPLRIEVVDRSGERESLFNARETAHLADVRELMRAVFSVQVISVAAALTLAVVMLALWPVRALAAAILYSALLTVGLVLAVGGVAMLGFDAAWDQFHFAAFSNDLWRLNPATDHLIQMFPEPFWRDMALLLGAMTLLEAMAMVAVGGVYLLLTRSEAADEPRPRLLRPPAVQRRPRIPPPHPRDYVRMR